MQNPTVCYNIRNKLDVSNGGVSEFTVNREPTPTVHIQRCYSDQTTTAAIQKCITEIWGTQYGGTTAGVITLPGRTSNKRFEVNTNVAGLVINVKLTLINELNEETEVTLTTNGTTYVPTTLANYKVCNDMVITSPRALTGSERVWCRAQGGTQNNIYYVVLTATGKFTPIFMVGSKNGVVRKARLIGMPQVYSQNTSLQVRAVVWPNSGSTPTVKLNFEGLVNSVTSIGVPHDGMLELSAGEWCLWHRSTGSSINTTVAVTAQWELIPA